MVDYQRPMHRQIEDIDPGWLKSEITAMARSALIAVGLSLMVGLSVSEYLGRAKADNATKIVVAPKQAARTSPTAISCADASSRCEKPASSR